MPFHVELSASSMRHARAFNLEVGELRRQILKPWIQNHTIVLGDREWLPKESQLRVLEGPHLEPPDLSFGQGWANAQRSAEDVTKRMLGEAEREAPPLPKAIAIAANSLEEAAAAITAGRDLRPIAYDTALEAIDRRDPGIAAIIVVTRTPPEPPEPGPSQN